MTIVLRNMPPAQEQAWLLLLRLGETAIPWILIGGQLIHLLANEHGARQPRVTLDADVLVDVRAKPGSIEVLCSWLSDHGLELEGSTPDGIGHRFSKLADPGPGTVSFDVLAPEGLGARTRVFTKRPFRTVSVPASQSLLRQAERVDVVVLAEGGAASVGIVNRPGVLSALVGKAAATTIPGRNPARDWEDAALLLSFLPNPMEARASLTSKESVRLARLHGLTPEHPAWTVLTTEERRQGQAAMRLLLGAT